MPSWRCSCASASLGACSVCFSPHHIAPLLVPLLPARNEATLGNSREPQFLTSAQIPAEKAMQKRMLENFVRRAASAPKTEAPGLLSLSNFERVASLMDLFPIPFGGPDGRVILSARGSKMQARLRRSALERGRCIEEGFGAGHQPYAISHRSLKAEN